MGLDNKLGLQDPNELIWYWSPIYVLCVSSHFWPFTKANLVLENFNKNMGSGQTPPPLVGPNAQIFPKNYFDGSPNQWSYCWNIKYWMLDKTFSKVDHFDLNCIIINDHILLKHKTLDDQQNILKNWPFWAILYDNQWSYC